MNEKYIRYLFQLARDEQYPGSMDEFVKRIQTEDNFFKYMLQSARDDQYKGTDEEFSIAIGKTKPQSTQLETVATEETAKAEPTTTEPAKELSNKPLETVKAKSIPEREVEMPIADETKMPKMMVREAAPIAEEVVKKEIPIGDNLMPVTEKTEVKSVETPSDKMVIKSEKKEEVKEQPKTEDKPQMQVKDVTEQPKEEVKEQPEGKPQMEVKEVTEQPKAEVKVENKKEGDKGIPSYDDLGINTEKEPGNFLDANKNVKFEKLSPNEIIEKGFLKYIGSDIKLERNNSLRYPDPPGVVFKKEKVGEREVYSSYDKANDKWYVYDENSNKNNWTEVKSGTIRTLLNSKYKKNNKIINSKTDYNSEEEKKEMTSMRRSVMLNKYLPYVMKNWDNLSNEQKQKVKKDLNSGGLNILLRKYLTSDDPNLDFWLDVNDKFFNNQATSSTAIDLSSDGQNTYEEKLFEIPNLNKDIKENKIKVLKSVAGDVFYDEKNDIFYYGGTFDRGELKREKSDDFDNGIVFTYLKTIPKGTPAYDKIKNSLSKYNK